MGQPFQVFYSLTSLIGCNIVRIQRGWGRQGCWTPLENHQNKGFLCNTGPDPIKKSQSYQASIQVGPSSARQRNVILMAFLWRTDDGLLLVVFGSPLPTSTKKNKTKSLSTLDHLWQSLLDPRMVILFYTLGQVHFCMQKLYIFEKQRKEKFTFS